MVTPAPGRRQLDSPAEQARVERLLASLRAEAKSRGQDSRATSTQRAYRSDWRSFEGWCADTGLTALPADTDTVELYLVSLVRAGAAVATAARHLSGIRHRHQEAGLPDPTAAPGVRSVLAGLQRDKRIRSRGRGQAPALKPPELWEVLDACPTEYRPQRDSPAATSLAGARDRALILVGFYGALRRSELSAATVEDLHEDTQGRGFVLEIPASKTDQEGKGQEVALPHTEPSPYCPTHALQEWLTLARITTGPIFRGVTAFNTIRQTALSAAAVTMIVDKAAVRAGLEPGKYSAHSLRAGFVTYADELGLPDDTIKRQTRHTADATLQRYKRHESIWTENAATGLPH